MRRALAVTLVLAACNSGESTTTTPGALHRASEAEFDQLTGLAGRWKCTGPDAAVDITYRLVSNESALVETFVPSSGGETLTIFHFDSPSLIATHYCAQGNQPRLALQSVTAGTFDFRFRDATNLPDPSVAHLDQLELELIDADRIERQETYVSGDQKEIGRLSCQRNLE